MKRFAESEHCSTIITRSFLFFGDRQSLYFSYDHYDFIIFIIVIYYYFKFIFILCGIHFALRDFLTGASD